jgi:hypothetical protein
VEAPIDHVENLNNQSSNAAAATPIQAEAAEHQPIIVSAFERDLGKRVEIWELPPDEQDNLGDNLIFRRNIIHILHDIIALICIVREFCFACYLCHPSMLDSWLHPWSCHC